MAEAPKPEFPEQFNLADYCLFARIDEGRGALVALRFGEYAFTYDEVTPLSRAVGCKRCGNSGYRGRLPLIEVAVVTPTLAAITSAELKRPSWSNRT